MNGALDLVLVNELDGICDDIDASGNGHGLLDKLLDMPKHIRVALAKRLMEDV